MKIEISYKNSLIGSLSTGESLALHLNGSKLTEDLIVRAVEDTVYTIKAGTYILHSNIISNTVTAWELTNLGVYVYDGTSYVSVIGGMLSFMVDGVEIHSSGFNYITCNGSAWVAHYTLDGEAIVSKPISYDPSYMRITVLEDTTVTKEYYDVFTANTDKKLSAPTITTDGTVVTITDTSGLATSFTFYHNGVGLFQTSSTVVNVSEMVLEDFGAGTYNITVTALADGYEESDHSNMVEYVVEETGVVIPAGTYEANFTSGVLSYSGTQDITFISNGISYISMDVTTQRIRYISWDSLIKAYDYSGAADIMGWQNTAYKTVTLTTDQTVTADFGEWFNANFTKQA